MEKTIPANNTHTIHGSSGYVGGFLATHLKNMIVNLDHFQPQASGVKIKIFELPPPVGMGMLVYGSYKVSSKGFKTIT